MHRRTIDTCVSNWCAGVVVSLGVRNLLKERMRLAISVGGVAFAVTLIVLIQGLFAAYQTRVQDYFERYDADLWVLEAGTADLFHSFSLVDDSLVERIRSIDGVEAAAPYLARQVRVRVHGEDAVTYLVGVEPGAVDPEALADVEEGGLPVRSDQVLIDRVFADRYGLGVGDAVSFEHEDLSVSGIATGGDLVMFQFAFTQEATARRILGLDEVDNAVIVTVAPDADRSSVSAEIQGMGDLLVRTTDQQVEVNQRPITDGFLPVIRVLVGLGFVVGAVVVGLMMYSAVLEKRRELGVLKAVGASTRDLAVVVLTQAAVASALGYLVGVGLSVLAARATAEWVPQFVTTLRPGDVAVVAVAVVGMALVAALAPLIRLSRIDPAEVFR